MKKIIITYARYGSGHESVAKNIYEYLVKSNEYEVYLLDMTSYANFWGKFSFWVMNIVAKYRPELIFSTGYELLNYKLIGKQQKKVVKIFFDNRKLRNHIQAINPNLIFSTHFYGSTLGVYYNQKEITNSKIITILTDYRLHSEWGAWHQNKDAFIVANKILKQELIEYGIPSNKVFPYGIPLETNKIINLMAKNKIYRRYNLDKTKKTIVFFGGSSSGSSFYFKYFKLLLSDKLNANLVFISGNNKKLRQEAIKIVNKKKLKHIKVLGFTNDVYNLLNISDFVITKPGGATVTECIEFKVPMLLIPGVGGQEKYNKRFIKRMGYGTFVRFKSNFLKVVNKFLNDEEYYKRMKDNLGKHQKQETNLLIKKLIDKIIKE